jgi:hypothetical protein
MKTLHLKEPGVDKTLCGRNTRLTNIRYNYPKLMYGISCKLICKTCAKLYLANRLVES